MADNRDNLPVSKTTENFLSTNIKDLSPESKDALLKMALESKIKTEEKKFEDDLKNRNADYDFERHLQAVHAFDNRSSKGINHVRTDINTASGHMRMDSNSNKCYVATATYQNSYHPNVVILRDYRDRFLKKTPGGRAFINIYYTIGKYLAFFPEHFESIRNLSKKVLDRIVDSIVERHYR